MRLRLTINLEPRVEIKGRERKLPHRTKIRESERDTIQPLRMATLGPTGVVTKQPKNFQKRLDTAPKTC